RPVGRRQRRARAAVEAGQAVSRPLPSVGRRYVAGGAGGAPSAGGDQGSDPAADAPAGGEAVHRDRGGDGGEAKDGDGQSGEGPIEIGGAGGPGPSDA